MHEGSVPVRNPFFSHIILSEMSPASESPVRDKSPFRRRRLRPGKPLSPKRILIFLLKLFIFIHLGYIIFTSTFILVYKFTNPVFTVLMPYRSIGYGWKLQKPIPVQLKQVPAYVRNMLVSVEDGKFYTHHGIDMEAFKRAQEINERVGKPLYGGSTLTMQVARTLFLVPEKSYVRKYFEVIAALELELILSKDRILELYFGYAEWGKGIFGMEAAARHYFGKGVASLTRDQAARLIALLSSPIKYTPSTLNKSAILRERYAYLTRRYVVPSQSASPDQSPGLTPPPGGVEPGADDPSADEAADEAMPEEMPIEASPAETPTEASPTGAGTIDALPADAAPVAAPSFSEAQAEPTADTTATAP